eukprot:4832783-Amphidinium_carterae.1
MYSVKVVPSAAISAVPLQEVAKQPRTSEQPPREARENTERQQVAVREQSELAATEEKLGEEQQQHGNQAHAEQNGSFPQRSAPTGALQRMQVAPAESSQRAAPIEAQHVSLGEDRPWQGTKAERERVAQTGSWQQAAPTDYCQAQHADPEPASTRASQEGQLGEAERRQQQEAVAVDANQPRGQDEREQHTDTHPSTEARVRQDAPSKRLPEVTPLAQDS